MNAYEQRIAALNRALGISENYGSERGLALQLEAAESELVVAGNSPDAREVRLTFAAAESWHALERAAAKVGIILLPWSGFRSVQRQSEIIQEKLSAGKALAEILRAVAAPGFSEHHTGRAIDIGAPDEPALEEGFGLTFAFKWLTDNAAAYGFYLSYPRGNTNGIMYEPWHWLYRLSSPAANGSRSENVIP